jgi:hypothetical protein
MTLIKIKDQQRQAEFAKKAAVCFAENDRAYTFTSGAVEPDEFFAVRWNSNTVLVLKLHEFHEQALYDTGQLIDGCLPPLKGDFDVNGMCHRDKRIEELEQAIRSALVALADGGPWAPGNAEMRLKQVVQ